METLFNKQVEKLQHHHFLILYWAAEAEVLGAKYNITNIFDDLKDSKITRTKQSAVAYVEALDMMCFVEVREERNRKNVYITEWGAEALKILVSDKNFKTRKSRFLGGYK